jgi:hypothetical protein
VVSQRSAAPAPTSSRLVLPGHGDRTALARAAVVVQPVVSWVAAHVPEPHPPRKGGGSVARAPHVGGAHAKQSSELRHLQEKKEKREMLGREKRIKNG